MFESSALRFPFGRPVLPCKPSANGPRKVFILGAYPSALHIRWNPQKPFRSIQVVYPFALSGESFAQASRKGHSLESPLCYNPS